MLTHTACLSGPPRIRPFLQASREGEADLPLLWCTPASALAAIPSPLWLSRPQQGFQQRLSGAGHSHNRQPVPAPRIPSLHLATSVPQAVPCTPDLRPRIQPEGQEWIILLHKSHSPWGRWQRGRHWERRSRWPETDTPLGLGPWESRSN